MEDFIGKQLNHDIIQQIHAAVENTELGYRSGFGSYPIKNLATNQTIYLPPDSDIYGIDVLIQELLLRLNSIESPIEKAAQLHWGLVKIHPFVDGNGRTARLLVVFVLRSNGYDDLICKRLEKYFENNRHEYNSSLDDGQLMYSGFKDVSPRFINYLEQGLGISEGHIQEDIVLKAEQTI